MSSSGTSATMKVDVSARHTPRFQVVCYVAQEDGELAGDVLEIEAECSLQHKVSRRGLALEDVGGACCRGWGTLQQLGLLVFHLCHVCNLSGCHGTSP